MKTLYVGCAGTWFTSTLLLACASSFVGCNRAEPSADAAHAPITEIIAGGPTLVTPGETLPEGQDIAQQTNDSRYGIVNSGDEHLDGSVENMAQGSSKDVWDPLSMPEPLSIPAASGNQVGDADAVEGTFTDNDVTPETASLEHGDEEESESLR